MSCMVVLFSIIVFQKASSLDSGTAQFCGSLLATREVVLSTIPPTRTNTPLPHATVVSPTSPQGHSDQHVPTQTPKFNSAINRPRDLTYRPNSIPADNHSQIPYTRHDASHAVLRPRHTGSVSRVLHPDIGDRGQARRACEGGCVFGLKVEGKAHGHEVRDYFFFDAKAMKGGTHGLFRC